MGRPLRKIIFPAAGMGTRFDAGNPLDFLIANTMLGLDHPEYGDELRSIIKKNL